MEIKSTFSLVKALSVSMFMVVAGFAQAATNFDHSAIDKARSGQRISVATGINAAATDSISQVRTYFRADNDGRWHFVPMRATGADYQGLLPAPDIHTEFVRYQLLAVTGSRELIKSEIYNIKIIKDEEALARLNKKPPTDVKIDASKLQDAQDIYEKLPSRERVTQADQQNIARSASEPTPESRVDTGSEYDPLNDAIPGFSDYINLAYMGSEESFGVAAGIVSSSAAASGAPTVKSASTAAASGGSKAGWILGGVALAGGAAAAGGGSGGGGSSTPAAPAPTPDPTPTPTPDPVTNFDGRWTGPQVCAATGDAAFRWVVDLNQTDDQVSGIIAFHKCPDEGRATYNVTGTATTSSSIQLNGTLASSQGPLAATAPANQVFTVSVGQPPSPNFAP